MPGAQGVNVKGGPPSPAALATETPIAKAASSIPKPAGVLVLWDLDNVCPFMYAFETARSIQRQAQLFHSSDSVHVYAVGASGRFRAPKWHKARLELVGLDIKERAQHFLAKNEVPRDKHHENIHVTERKKVTISRQARSSWWEVVPLPLKEDLVKAGVLVSEAPHRKNAADKMLEKGFTKNMARYGALVLISGDLGFRKMVKKAKAAAGLHTTIIANEEARKKTGKLAHRFLPWSLVRVTAEQVLSGREF